MLEARKIRVELGREAILKGIDLTVSPGEFVAVVGPNGAGKTTLLRLLNGAVRLKTGEVLLDGCSHKSYSRAEIARRISVVAQENETKFPITVREFVLAGRYASGGAFGWESEDDCRVADSAIGICELEGLADRFMNELSGGERQRVLLARAFASESQILLLDEPTNNLDLSNQALMLKLVKARCETLGTAAVVVTHDLNLAASFAGRILMLKDGEILFEGSPENTFTAGKIKTVFGIDVICDRNPETGNIRITTLF